MNSFKLYLTPPCLRMLALGFSAGLPYLLVFGTLSTWLREAGVDRTTIGWMSGVTLAYAFKWTWSPLVDRLTLPILGRLGRRRSWLLLSQIGLILGLMAIAFSDPKQSLWLVASFAVFTAVCAATQDIALDAFRIESANINEQAALAATYQAGYRLAMMWASAGVLWIAAQVEIATSIIKDPLAWRVAYSVMALSMLIGLLTVAFAKEPQQVNCVVEKESFQQWIQSAVIAPFVDFFKRYGKQALVILLLIGCYRISDIVMGVMANAFYIDMGYTKLEIANVTKVYGLAMTLLGAFIGGALVPKLGAGAQGVMRLMMLGAVLSSATNLLFAWLSSRGHDVAALTAVVSADNLAGGLASAAFIAYLSSLTNVQYTATQYALFSSLMHLLPNAVALNSGYFVDSQGYANFFNATALLGLPVLVLVWWAARLPSDKTQAKP
jgi:MFS transporter, PAT family, beta-lactamase induction signal transducer AmpG